MRWEDERYVRFYTRDTPEFLALSWTARALFGLIMRKVDRAGILPVGKLGLKGVAVAVGGPWVEVEAPLRELIDDGCVLFNESRGAIILPNFIPAQEASQSDAARKRASRERARADFGASTDSPEKAHIVTRCDEIASRDVTQQGHVQSHPVTSGHTRSLCAVSSVPSDPSRTEDPEVATPPPDEPRIEIEKPGLLALVPTSDPPKAKKPPLERYVDAAFDVWKSAWLRRTGKSKTSQLLADERARLKDLFAAKVPLERIELASLGIHDSPFHRGENDRDKKFMRLFHALSAKSFDDLAELGEAFLAAEQAARAVAPRSEPMPGDAARSLATLRSTRQKILDMRADEDELVKTLSAESIP